MIKYKFVYFSLLVFFLLSTCYLNAQEVFYTNHLGLFNILSNAKTIKNILEDHGFKVYISGKPPYRVTVGRYEDWSEALKIEKKLSNLNYDSYIIEIWQEYIKEEKEKKGEEKEGEEKEEKEEEGLPIVQAQKEIKENNKNLRDVVTKNEVTKNEVTKNEVTKNVVTKNVVIPEENTGNMENNMLVKKNSIFLVENNSILKGMFGSQTLFFFFNRNWEAQNNNYLNLNFSYYQTRLNKNSSLTVYFNEKPIYNLQLSKQEVGQENVKIKIPKEMIVEGYNSIKILLDKIDPKSQTDDYNTANWFMIKDTTAICLNYIELKEDLKISDYPYPFLNIGQKNPVDSVFVIPQEYTNYHLTTLAYLVAGIGKREPYEDLNIKVITSNSLGDYKDQNLIFIGNDKDFKNFEGFPETSSKNNAIELLSSPWDKEKTILNLKGQEEKIIDLGRILFFDNIVGQMKRKKQIIDSFDSQFNDNIRIGSNVSFESLGYGNINLKGRYQLKSIYNYKMPAGWQLTEEASLNLKYRYSQAIDFEESLIVVKVNDIPIASKKLSKEGAAGDNLICKFPENLLTEQSFNIEVQFHLGQQIGGENNWAVISNQSYLQMPHEQVKTTSLENYPYLFFEDSTLQDLIVVLSNQADIYDINMMAKVFAYIGRLANNIRDIHVIRAHSLINEMKNKNILLLGRPGDNPIIKQINEYLPVSFNRDFTKLISTNEYFFLDEVGQEAGIVQIIDSIWNSEKVIVIASAANKLALRNTDLLLSSRNIAPRLSGEATMMDNFGEIYNFGNKNIEETTMVVDVKEKVLIFARDNRRSLIVLGIMISLIIIISVIVYIFYKKPKQKYFLKESRANEK